MTSSNTASAASTTAAWRLMSIHAHPDDESSKGAPTTARYVENGVHAVLVCATGGEEGDIINKSLKGRPEIEENLKEVRREELANATAVIGYATTHMLGYRDSGMKDSEANERPECFWATPIEESTARFAQLIRDERPHVMISYAPARGGYDHPDHERVHVITDPAIAMAADPGADLAGEPWQVLKLYYSTWSKARLLSINAKYDELGLESPFDEKWLSRPGHDHLVTTRISIGPWWDRRRAALLAHATQVDPDEKFWFGLPPEAEVDAYPYEDFERVWTKGPVWDGLEGDLFAGIEGWPGIEPVPGTDLVVDRGSPA